MNQSLAFLGTEIPNSARGSFFARWRLPAHGASCTALCCSWQHWRRGPLRTSLPTSVRCAPPGNLKAGGPTQRVPVRATRCRGRARLGTRSCRCCTRSLSGALPILLSSPPPQFYRWKRLQVRQHSVAARCASFILRRGAHSSLRRVLQSDLPHGRVRARQLRLRTRPHSHSASVLPRQRLACPNWPEVAASLPLLRRFIATSGIDPPCTLPDFSTMPRITEIVLSSSELTGAARFSRRDLDLR